MIRRQGTCRNPPARLHSRAARQAFQAIAVIWAGAREGISREIVGQTEMTDFRMQQSMNEPAVRQNACAHAGSNGDVDGIGKSARCAPTLFGEQRGVDIRIERCRYTESVAYRA